MKYSKFLQSYIIVSIFAFLTFVPAYSGELPDSMNDFVHSYLSAAKQNDLEAIKKLSHPAFLECSVESGPENYDQLVQQQIRIFSKEDPIMKIDYQPFSAEDLKEMAKSMKKRKIKWPVSPDGRVIIMYSSFHKISKVAIFVAQDSTGWKWVHYCNIESEEEVQPVAVEKKNKLSSFLI